MLPYALAQDAAYCCWPSLHMWWQHSHDPHSCARVALASQASQTLLVLLTHTCRASPPQLVIIADFYQLPPVDADRERPEDWVAMQQDPQQQQVCVGGGVAWRAARKDQHAKLCMWVYCRLLLMLHCCGQEPDTPMQLQSMSSTVCSTAAPAALPAA